MRTKTLALLFVPLMAAFTAQAKAASVHHPTRTKSRAVAAEQWRDSNAHVPPVGFAAPPDSTEFDDGAMASGIAGH